MKDIPKFIGLTPIKDRTYTLNQKGLRKNSCEYIVLHSTGKQRFADVLGCHLNNGWDGIGYHLFISSKNKVFQGRPFNLEGAHALGFNTNSLSLCIYSNNSLPNKKTIKKGREILKGLQKHHPNSKIIPHTLAQIIYNNRLLRNASLDFQFPEEIDVAKKGRFEEIKLEMTNLINKLENSKYETLKKHLKWFKNCPGEMFYYFI
ncbi:MAG TPA: peptidoglycan recognition family protein [Bacillota bacterium]|nr:peptidoglycan recognition family protein [Bacillota bacterium]